MFIDTAKGVSVDILCLCCFFSDEEQLFSLKYGEDAMKKLCLFCIVCVLSLAVCFAQPINAAEKKAEFVIKTGIGYNDKSLQFKTLEFMKKCVEDFTDGAITMELYHSSALGDDLAVLEGLQMGTIEMFCGTIGPAAQFSSKVKLFDLPFLFTSYDQAYAVLDGEIGQEVLDSLSPAGMVGIGYWENGFRNVTNNVRPVKTPADLQGLKLRTMPTPVPLSTFKLLGANPTPMNFGEVFTALQQGVVDGQENPWETILANRFYEVQKYATNTGHVYSPFGVIFSKIFWDKLTPEYQKSVRDAVFAARTYNRIESQKSVNRSIEELRKQGMDITILSPAEIAEFQKLVTPVYDEFAGEIGVELVNKTKEFLKNYNN